MKISRPTWDEYFTKVAVDIGARATCTRHKFGCVIVNSRNELVSTGYNGPPHALEHCSDIGCLRDKMKIPSGTRMEICRAVHAEMNALLQAGKNCRNGTLYVNGRPCTTCAKMIINARIKKVVVSGFYADAEGVKLMRKAKIKVIELYEDSNKGSK